VFFAYLDASALAKRYVPELGTAEINHVFARMPAERLVVFNVGTAEVVSLFVRKRNAGRLDAASFQQAMADFVAEIAAPLHPAKLAADNVTVFAAYALIDAHSINSTDAVLLQSALALAGELRLNGDDLIIVASDQRLLKAARAEGLVTFDPESQTQAEFDVLVGP